MGFLARLRGTERPAAVQQAIDALEQQLPDGWRFAEFREQMFGRRPVKLYAYGALAEGPDARRALTVAGDGIDAVNALMAAVLGRMAATRLWAPPPIRPRERRMFDRPLMDAESPEEDAARQEALALLPAGAAPMDADREKFGDVTVHGAVVQLPELHSLAGVGLTAADAWHALGARLRGELPESPVWTVPVS